MPIRIPDHLPAFSVLQEENVFAMTNFRALHQDIRPLRVLILNLMPTKIVTEIQLLRLLSNTPLQIDIDLLKTNSYSSRNTSAEHLESFYKTFDEIKNNRYDGMIVTGAPVENMDFDEVLYWNELLEILDYAKENVHSSVFICWGAQAALKYYYNISKYPLDHKLSGVFPHTVTNKKHPLVRGFDDIFYVPHSRYTMTRLSDIENCPDLDVIATSEQAGLYLCASKDMRKIFITGHSEYDSDTLATEYFRDLDKNLKIDMPYNYFPDNDPTKTPPASWTSHANLLFSNWLNYCIYQTVSYDFVSPK